jgi:hypothetical protein
MTICPIKFTEEIWKDVEIDGVKKDHYQVSTSGNVRNFRGQLLKPEEINTGYLVYKLYTGHGNPGKYKHVLAHRLVKQTFQPIDNQSEMTVNHRDADKHNNNYDNLEWCTQAENNEHGIVVHKKYGSNNYQAKFNKDQLVVILDELKKGTRYKDILNIIGVEDNDNNRDYIGNIKRGRTYQREIAELNNGSSTIES